MNSSFLSLPNVDRCAFCDYLSGLRPYTIVARGAHTALLVTREQRGLSHLLAVPVRHRATILDLKGDESRNLMCAVIIAADAVVAASMCDGIAIWQNNGLSADQTIPHVHFHIAGTLGETGTERGHVAELGIEQTELIARQLHPHIRDIP